MERHVDYSVEYLPPAVNDITEIVASYIFLESKQGAMRIKKKIKKAVEQTKIFPYSGKIVFDEKLANFGFRVLVVEKYLLFYKVFETDKKIVVYRVLHGQRNYPSLFSRFAQ